MLGGRYRVIDAIGSGGMAEVFRAHDELLARDVAVKVFRSLHVASDPATGIERQRIELQALARLNHPNLITLFDGTITSTDGPAFLVMELVNGPSLAAQIAQAPLAEPQAREVGIQIADALGYVHAEGMVHRDVKPANILLGTDRTTGDTAVRARLSDFGIVRLLGSERLTSAEFTLGTASYLAPEQARGSDVGPAADMYSLGLVLLEALTAVRSYDGPALEAVLARLTHGPDVPADLPAPWPALLTAMTALDPGQRPTAEQVTQTLRGARAGSAALAPAAASSAAGPAAAAEASTVGLAAVGMPAAALAPAGGDPWDPPEEPPHRRRGAWLLAAGLAVALVAAAFLILRPTSHSKPPADGVPATTQASHPHTSGAHSGQPASSASRSGGSAGSSATHSASTPASSPAHSTGAPPSTSPAPPASTSAGTTPSTSTSTSTGASTSASTSSTPANP